jgi:hypothetical protein
VSGQHEEQSVIYEQAAMYRWMRDHHALFWHEPGHGRIRVSYVVDKVIYSGPVAGTYEDAVRGAMRGVAS